MPNSVHLRKSRSITGFWYACGLYDKGHTRSPEWVAETLLGYSEVIFGWFKTRAEAVQFIEGLLL